MPDKYEDEEPPASTREMARNLREIYVALVHEGFTENQALQILAHMTQAAIMGNGPK